MDPERAGDRADVRCGPETRDALATQLRTLLERAPENVLSAWLFGSRARGDARADSDVDLAVLFRRHPEPRLGNDAHLLEGRLEEALGAVTQLVVVNSAPPDLVHRILRDGVLLLDRDPLARARFEVHARNERFDLEPFLRRYREARR